MKPSNIALKTPRIALPKPETPLYKFASITNISYRDLPNNGFGQQNYHIKKTKFGHWPVYLKVQNTKRTTEVKRIRGDLMQFKNDLLQLRPDLKIHINEKIGYANIKGDVVDEIKHLFSNHIEITQDS